MDMLIALHHPTRRWLAELLRLEVRPRLGGSRRAPGGAGRGREPQVPAARHAAMAYRHGQRPHRSGLHPDLRIVDDLVERWFSALTTKKLQRSAHRTAKVLGADIRSWAEIWNDNPKPFTWHKSADDMPQRLAGYCTAINQGATASTLTGR
jgi:hypothetical protein